MPISCPWQSLYRGQGLDQKINLYFNRRLIVFPLDFRYPVGMTTLPQPKPGGWLLLVGPPSMNSTALSAIVQLTQKGPLRIVDCAGYFQTELPVQRKSPDDSASQSQLTIEQVTTCEQVFEALKSMRSNQTEIVVLDMLRPFFTHRGDFQECKRVLKACIKQLDRLAKKANGIVTVSPPVVPTSTTLQLLAVLKAWSNGSLSSDPFGNDRGGSSPARQDHPFSDLSLY
jgi:hypothetical protein